MQFCWCTLTVRDLAASLHFYQEIVGLPLVRRFSAGPDTEIAFLGSGETQVELIHQPSKTEIRKGEDISLGFVCPSLDAMQTKLQAHGIAVHAGPYQPNPYIRFFYVLDPDGLKVQFVEHLD